MSREHGSKGDKPGDGRPDPGHDGAKAMQIDDPTLKDLLGYWERLRAGREVPYRSEIDPRQFEGALDHMFILEHLGEGNIRFRVAGLALCEMMGMELRGMSLRALMRVEDRAALDAALGQMLGGPAVAHLRLDAHAPSGGVREAAMLLMPLRSDLGDISRVMGCLRIRGSRADAAAPLRFAIRAAEIEPVAVRSTVSPVIPGLAEAPARFEPAGPALRAIEGGARRRGGKRANHLRLVDKGE
jgi:hypothetical protein